MHRRTEKAAAGCYVGTRPLGCYIVFLVPFRLALLELYQATPWLARHGLFRQRTKAEHCTASLLCDGRDIDLDQVLVLARWLPSRD